MSNICECEVISLYQRRYDNDDLDMIKFIPNGTDEVESNEKVAAVMGEKFAEIYKDSVHKLPTLGDPYVTISFPEMIGKRCE